MGSIVNVRMPPELLAQAETMAKQRGYLSVQEYVREAVRQDIERQTRLKARLDAIIASAKDVKARKLTREERDRLALEHMRGAGTKVKRLTRLAREL